MAGRVGTMLNHAALLLELLAPGFIERRHARLRVCDILESLGEVERRCSELESDLANRHGFDMTDDPSMLRWDVLDAIKDAGVYAEPRPNGAHGRTVDLLWVIASSMDDDFLCRLIERHRNELCAICESCEDFVDPHADPQTARMLAGVSLHATRLRDALSTLSDVPMEQRACVEFAMLRTSIELAVGGNLSDIPEPVRHAEALLAKLFH